MLGKTFKGMTDEMLRWQTAKLQELEIGRDATTVYVRPDLVVEISSPATRRRDLTLKRDLYERFGVTQYWFVDLEAERVEVHRLREGRYGSPDVLRATDTLRSVVLPGFSFDLSTILDAGDP